MSVRFRVCASFPGLFLVLIASQGSLAVASGDATKPEQKVVVDQDGLVHIPAFAVPLSRYMSEEAKRS